MTFLRTVVLVGLLLALAGPAAGQSCEEFMGLPPVGQWAEWRGGPGQAGRVRIALLSQETRQGRTFLRSEMRMVDAGRTVIVQSLATIDPPVLVEEMILKRGTEAAVKLPRAMMNLAAAASQSNPGRAACTGNLVLVGPESVTVPAGTFAAVKFRDPRGAYFWFSTQVPFALAKGQSETGEELVLAGYGSNAASEITETPVEAPER
ncbi:MAG TPA: hypothetical protein VFN71_10890 [Methylomirabilota bacterium]|nr:hypothetical protein [Methylomirabilota bacterium]